MRAALCPAQHPSTPPTKTTNQKNTPKKKGTGKTLIARACAAQTNATFLKLAGPQLVQMFIGDGAKMVRDAFALAKEKAPAIIFIDEIDAIGTKRFDSELSGDREVQRTMLELLNQLDGFTSSDAVKVRGAGVCVCVCARVCGWLVGCCWLLVVVVAGGGCWWWWRGCCCWRGGLCCARFARCVPTASSPSQHLPTHASYASRHTTTPKQNTQIKNTPKPKKRSSPRPTGPTSSTPRSCAAAGSTARSSSRTPTRPRAPRCVVGDYCYCW